MQRIISDREKLMFYLTIGVIFFAFIFNFFIAPVLNKNNHLNKQILFYREKLKKYLYLLSHKETILKKQKEISFSPFVSEQQTDATVSFLAEIEKVAKNTNLRIVEIRPQPRAGKDVFKEIFVDLKTEGGTEEHYRFIYQIEHSLLLLTIKSLQLKSKSNSMFLEGVFSISGLSTSP
ncbi:MAG: hypothetical protein NC923_05035 [Candidatus Omnitrophica bacterium]|nr:hypothetical protein [Candidatus Omnitrophota bacterium]